MGSESTPDAVFTHDIKVRWSDCDPARIAYTGRIPYFALEAIDAWWEHTIGADWFRLNVDQDIGTPFVHLSMDFKSPVTPRHILTCAVRLVHLGNSSVRFCVIGAQNGSECFEGEFVEVFADSGVHQKRAIPEKYRHILAERLAGVAQ